MTVVLAVIKLIDSERIDLKCGIERTLARPYGSLNNNKVS